MPGKQGHRGFGHLRKLPSRARTSRVGATVHNEVPSDPGHRFIPPLRADQSVPPADKMRSGGTTGVETFPSPYFRAQCPMPLIGDGRQRGNRRDGRQHGTVGHSLASHLRGQRRRNFGSPPRPGGEAGRPLPGEATRPACASSPCPGPCRSGPRIHAVLTYRIHPPSGP